MERRTMLGAALTACFAAFRPRAQNDSDPPIETIDMAGMRVTASSGKTEDDRPVAVIEFPIGQPGEAGEITLDWLRWVQVKGEKFGILEMRLAVDGDVMKRAVDGTETTACADFGLLASRAMRAE